jgi:hypothetical protein
MRSGKVQRYEVHLEWRRATDDDEHYVYAIALLLLIIGSQVRALVLRKPHVSDTTPNRAFLGTGKLTLNQRVPGSSPGAPTTQSPGIELFR